MHVVNVNVGQDDCYPIIIFPKESTNLISSVDNAEHVVIDLEISYKDTEGNSTRFYDGISVLKFIEASFVQKTSEVDNVDYICEPEPSSPATEKDVPVILAEVSVPELVNQESEVWIDPSRSPFVYNQCSQLYEELHASSQCITYQKTNNSVSKYGKACPDTTQLGPKRVRKVKASKDVDTDSCFEDDFECGMYMPKLAEDIVLEAEHVVDRRDGADNENDALKQLLSNEIQKVSRQRKTILYQGNDAHHGQTIQKVAYTDADLECPGYAGDVQIEVEIEDTDFPAPKKYQCAKCEQIFDQINELRKHMIHHTSNRCLRTRPRGRSSNSTKYCCEICGKTLNSLDKFKRHSQGHGNPDLECPICRKIYASKFTLRVHLKIHDRKYLCQDCPRTYEDADGLNKHVAKVHGMYNCNVCEYQTKVYSEMSEHQAIHDEDCTKESDLVDSLLNGMDCDILDSSSTEFMDWRMDTTKSADFEVQAKEADTILEKVMANKLFLANKPRGRRYSKACEVCMKTFDRVSDLKRHLIEHVVRSTLAKNPVSRKGVLNILCVICNEKTFREIDQYKAHLREHANLTLYQCTFCNKSFSDSSNFSKHKKIHGFTYLQCDLCQRKFNSKKMIAQHMEHHNKHPPQQCLYCDKVYHFESMLNKHMKNAHSKGSRNKYRCKFCLDYFKTLKDKWEHEWMFHNMRRMMADCDFCPMKFRKYAELKRHCKIEHEYIIPPSKKFKQ